MLSHYTQKGMTPVVTCVHQKCPGAVASGQVDAISDPNANIGWGGYPTGAQASSFHGAQQGSFFGAQQGSFHGGQPQTGSFSGGGAYNAYGPNPSSESYMQQQG